MGGKTGTTTSSVSIPPEVLARYNSVNAQAQTAAGTPFQQYSTDPNAFVAPLNAQQQQGVGNINQQAMAAQPGYQTAMQGTQAASQGYNGQNYQQGVQAYMNPYLQNAMGSTAAMLQNQNQQQQNQLMGNAIQQGAFGGDRGNIAQAALMGQQNLAMGQTLGQMANQGYQQSAQNYMQGLQQQGALANQYGNLAGAAQTAGLQGAQAQLGAGTLGQQTEQAGKTALYNQFQQQQAYPFQVAQFLANIAEGTGALSGSTTTTTQPMPFFSDRRLKHDIKRVGTAENGLPIYKFKYKGDDSEQTHVGFMADEVEKVHPEAVGLAGGYKTVDYDKASEPVHKYAGGLVSEGGAVGPQHAGMGFADGGYAETTAFGKYDPYDTNSFYNLLNRQQSALKNPNSTTMRQMSGEPGLAGRVPQANVPVGQLRTAGAAPSMPESVLQQGLGAADEIEQGGKLFTGAKDYLNKAYDYMKTLDKPAQARGGLVGYADGGDVPYDSSDDPMEKVAKNSQQPERKLATAANPPGNPSQSGLGMGDLLSAGKLASSMGGLGAASQLPSLYSAAAAPLPDVVGAMATGGEEAFAAPEAVSGLGAAMSGIGDAAASALPIIFAPFGFSSGGLVDREHHDGSEGNVVGDSNGLDSKLQYKIAPQNLADMDPVQQQVVKTIYGGESGGQYDVLNGGEKFDTSQGHPHRVGKGGQSTAAGAGQFIGDTWDRVTGGAPMTPGYQDAATWKLASDDYQNRTGRDLKQDVSENGFTPEIKKALAPTWTSLAQKESPKDNGGLLSGLGNMFGIGSAQAQEQPQNQGGLLPQTGLFSEQTIIPLLSGLGSMASSKSPYLGAAILQGLGGGAKAYEDVRTQQMERQALSPVISQRNIQTANELTNGWLNYKATSGTDISLADYAKMVGYQGNIPSAGMPGQAPAGGGAPGGYSYSATEYLNPNTTVQRNGVTLNAMNDPLYLQNFVRQNSISTSLAIQNLVKQAETRLKEIEQNKVTTDVNGNSVNAPGVIAAGQQSVYAGNKVAQANKFVDQGNDFAATVGPTRQALQDLQDAYSKYRAGTLGTDRSALDRIAQELDPNGKIPALHGLSQDSSSEQYDIAMKSAAQLVARQLQGMSTAAPKSEIGLLNSFAANPVMSPGAIRSIIVRGKALVDYNQALHSNFRPENEDFDVQNYQNKFNSQHNYANEFIGKNEKETPWMKGQAPAAVQNENDIARLPSGAPFIVPYGPSKGQIRYAP